MPGVFVNPFTDFGFKKLFGTESNKDILMDFLNELLREDEGEITSLTFLRNERLGSLDIDRRAVFDLYCESASGSKFIVEMQKAKQDFFKERSVFYATFPIQDQAKRGTWNYDMKSVYTVGILDFVFQEDKTDKDKMLYRVKLSDIETSKVFYDKLTFVYLEMPKFTKSLDECETHFDKWLYLLRNLGELDNRPAKLTERIFQKLFGEAELASFTKTQLDAYQDNLKIYWDMQGALDTAKAEGERLGIVKGKAEGERLALLDVARNLRRMGQTSETIAACTRLPLDLINSL